MLRQFLDSLFGTGEQEAPSPAPQPHPTPEAAVTPMQPPTDIEAIKQRVLQELYMYQLWPGYVQRL